MYSDCYSTKDMDLINIETIENITGGGFYIIDVTKQTLWLSDNCSKMLGGSGKKQLL